MKIKFLTALLLVSTIAFGQKSFQGRVTYGIEYTELPAQLAGMEAMLPDEMVVSIRDNMSRVDQSMGMGMRQSTIVDTKTGKAIMLLDMMGKKVSVEMSEDELDKKEKKVKPEIKYLEGTKDIAGYTCKMAEISMTKEMNPVTVYYTEELPAGASRQFKGLKGFPLQYQISQQGMTMSLTASKVEKAEQPASDFKVPDGFEKMTFEQFGKAFGGM